MDLRTAPLPTSIASIFSVSPLNISLNGVSTISSTVFEDIFFPLKNLFYCVVLRHERERFVYGLLRWFSTKLVKKN